MNECRGLCKHSLTQRTRTVHVSQNLEHSLAYESSTPVRADLRAIQGTSICHILVFSNKYSVISTSYHSSGSQDLADMFRVFDLIRSIIYRMYLVGRVSGAVGWRGKWDYSLGKGSRDQALVTGLQ